MLREAKIIIPAYFTSPEYEDETSSVNVRNEVTAELVKRFGGCTTSEASGAWKDKDGSIVSEPVFVLTFAHADNAGLGWFDLARLVGTDCNQEAVYTVGLLGPGIVYILERGIDY